jgi:membrane protease YdiL (CAAX protease family)
LTLVVIFYCRIIEGRKLPTLGLRRRGLLSEYLSGLLIGTLMIAASTGVCLLTGTLDFKGISPSVPWGLIALFFLGFVIQGSSEELFCRGYFLNSLARRQSLPVAMVISSAAFSALHFFNPNTSLVAFLNLFLFGLFAAVYFVKRGDIWGISAIHTAWNFVQGNVLGIEVSGAGTGLTVASFSPTSTGTLINGGAFGLEGGLAVTLVLLVGILIVLLTRSRNVAEPGQGETSEEPA